MMELSIRSQHMKVDSALRETIALRLRFALARFSERIRSVDVQIADVNGPRGGVDKRSRIAIHLAPTGSVLIEERDADVHVAVTKAFQRAARAIVRALERRRGRRKSAAPFRGLPSAAIDDSGRRVPAVIDDNKETNS
jgi:putative sigma-54 modulation protein